MKIISVMIAFSFFVLQQLCGQVSSATFGFKSFSISNDSLGKIDYHISLEGIEQQKPVLLYLDGSGPFPLFQYMEKGGFGSSVPFDVKVFSKSFHVILISKPGVPFIDSVKKDVANGMPVYIPGEEYNKRLSLQWRTAAADLVLKEAVSKINIDKNKVVILGISEGFQVGAQLLSVNKQVTHAILVVGNGLNQLFDFIIFNRLQAAEGLISAEEAQNNIDSLYAQYKEMYSEPTATHKEWYGHSYLRWVDFSNSIPMQHLLQTNIPVLIIAASQDRNTTVLSTDYLYLESLRNGKQNIHYKVYPYNHMMQEVIKDSSGKTIVKRHMKDVLEQSIQWLQHQ